MFISASKLITEQTPDILIVDNQRYYLKSFPLENLDLKENYTKGDSIEINSGCWRGYQATWKVRNDSLFLIKLTDCYKNREYDLQEFFIRKTPIIHLSGTELFAYWYTADLVHYNQISFGGEYEQNYLWSISWREINESEKIIMSFKNGILTQKPN